MSGQSSPDPRKFLLNPQAETTVTLRVGTLVAILDAIDDAVETHVGGHAYVATLRLTREQVNDLRGAFEDRLPGGTCTCGGCD